MTVNIRELSGQISNIIDEQIQQQTRPNVDINEFKFEGNSNKNQETIQENKQGEDVNFLDFSFDQSQPKQRQSLSQNPFNDITFSHENIMNSMITVQKDQPLKQRKSTVVQSIDEFDFNIYFSQQEIDQVKQIKQQKEIQKRDQKAFNDIAINY